MYACSHCASGVIIGTRTSIRGYEAAENFIQSQTYAGSLQARVAHWLAVRLSRWRPPGSHTAWEQFRESVTGWPVLAALALVSSKDAHAPCAEQYCYQGIEERIGTSECRWARKNRMVKQALLRTFFWLKGKSARWKWSVMSSEKLASQSGVASTCRRMQLCESERTSPTAFVREHRQDF